MRKCDIKPYQHGDKFGDFIVVKHSKTEDYKRYYEIECAICGKRKEIYGGTLKQLKRVSHKYCNIGEHDKSKEYQKFHRIYLATLYRTRNKKCEAYDNYGGRGIYSEYTSSFADFYNEYYGQFLDAATLYGLDKVQIDRIDNNGSYVSGNIRFTTAHTQARNRRTNKNFVAISPDKIIYNSNVVKDFVAKYLKLSDYTAVVSMLNKKYKYKTVKGWIFSYI